MAMTLKGWQGGLRDDGEATKSSAPISPLALSSVMTQASTGLGLDLRAALRRRGIGAIERGTKLGASRSRQVPGERQATKVESGRMGAA